MSTELTGEKKVALVTGANKGIGLAIARQLGQQGITVLLGCRDEERGEIAAKALQAEDIAAHFVPLDLTRTDTIEAAAQTIEAQFGKLDILVNNAAIALDDFYNPGPSVLPLDNLRRTYDTNFFGTFAVTQAMLPLLRKAEAGRIVNLSTDMGTLTYNNDPEAPFKFLAYNSSKAALNVMTMLFALELKDTPIKVNAAHPGFVATDLTFNMGPLTPEQGATAPVRLATLPADGPSGGFFNEAGALPW